MKKATIVVLAAFIVFSSLAQRIALAAPDCSVCEEFVKWSAKNKSAMARLYEIQTINDEYLKNLSPSDESQRMKASSNLRIALKRIEFLKNEREQKLALPENVNCMNCLEVKPDVQE
jgi:hypothetical protein